MKYACELIEDVLPLFKDGALSEVSMGIVQEHLDDCPSCSALFVAMQSDDTLTESVASNIFDHEGALFSKKIRWVRRLVLGVFLTIIIGMAILFTVYVHMTRSEVITGVYETYESAIDTIEHGWIPEEIPKTARDIFVIYDLDTNVVNGSFRISEEEMADFSGKIEVADISALEPLHSALIPEWDTRRYQIIENAELDQPVEVLQNTDFIFVFYNDGQIYFWSK